MKTGDLCPRCNYYRLDEEEVMNALSRKDNKTYICDNCGRDEALEEFAKLNLED